MSCMPRPHDEGRRRRPVVIVLIFNISSIFQSHCIWAESMEIAHACIGYRRMHTLRSFPDTKGKPIRGTCIRIHACTKLSVRQQSEQIRAWATTRGAPPTLPRPPAGKGSSTEARKKYKRGLTPYLFPQDTTQYGQRSSQAKQYCLYEQQCGQTFDNESVNVILSALSYFSSRRKCDFLSCKYDTTTRN